VFSVAGYIIEIQAAGPDSQHVQNRQQDKHSDDNETSRPTALLLALVHAADCTHA
jgi:hypothetical protein